jgi:hypothetical protein
MAIATPCVAYVVECPDGDHPIRRGFHSTRDALAAFDVCVKGRREADFCSGRGEVLCSYRGEAP